MVIVVVDFSRPEIYVFFADYMYTHLYCSIASCCSCGSAL